MSETATRTDRLKATHEKLQEAVQSIVTGEDWQRMLRTAAKFHRYSLNNHQVEPHSIGPSAAISCGGSASGRKILSDRSAHCD